MSRAACGDDSSQTVRRSKKVAHDAEGRLLKDPSLFVDVNLTPEDPEVFVSKFQCQILSAKKDWHWTSKYAWPDIDDVVILKRFDLYETELPRSQVCTSDLSESRRIRESEGWSPVKSFFFMDRPLKFTKEICIESTGPPRRHRFRPHDKSNNRDFTVWLPKEKINAWIGADRIPGAADVCVDYCDLPDRYFLSAEPEPELGRRRLFRFAGYPATQYYILECKVIHGCLDSEGGSGMTYTIKPGPLTFRKKDWRVIGSFYGFDNPLAGSTLVTVYTRTDPFERMIMALAPFDKCEEWDSSIKFYAFDIPLPGTICYRVQHCNRSIYSLSAVIPRHRVTTDDERVPWEFRMNIYVMPAALEDCSFTDDAPVADEDRVYSDDEDDYA